MKSRGLWSLVIWVSLGGPFCWAAENGDTYVEASLGDASTLNPLLMSDSSSGDIVNLVFNGLVKYDKDIRLVGDLARSWDISPDGLTITFHLRRGVRWHDGHPFTSRDVVFTFQRLRDPKVRTPFSSDFEMVRSVRALDAYTVQVVYQEPFAPGLASWGIGMVPQHIFEKGDFNTHPANRRPIGTGPYRFKEWKTDRYILLEANPDYFEGRPHIDRYLYRIIPDQAVQFLEMRNQSVDALSLSPDQFKAYDAIFENHRRFRYPAFRYIYLGFNLRHPLFQDRRVRQALSLAVDRAALVQGILLGLGQPLTGPFPVTSWAYNPQVPLPSVDLGRARRLLQEAGWTLNAKGVLEKEGRPFRFTLMTNQGNKVRALTAEVLQDQLARLGVQVDIRVMEWSTFIREYIDKRNFEAILLGWQLGREPDNYAMWHSSQQKEGQYNFCGYNNPEVDRLLVEGRRVFDPVKRQKIYWKIHAQLAEDVPYLFLFCPDELVAIHKRFRGPEVAPLGLGWNFKDWYAPRREQRQTRSLIP